MRYFFGLLYLFLGIKINAQETLPIYQQYLLGGNYLINPALYGATDDVVLHATYQKQFLKLNHSPSVQNLGIHANVVDRLGAGISFFKDQNGPISAIGIGAGASYFVPLSDDSERKDQFSFGTAVHFYQMGINLELLNAESADPLLQEGMRNLFIAYANIGAQISYRNFFGGLSVLDIPLSNNIPVINGIEPSPSKYLFQVGYDLPITKNLYLEPSLLLNLNSRSARTLDINMIGKLKNDDYSFATGISLRATRDHGGYQRLNLSPLIKGEIGSFSFGATYNWGLSSLQIHTGNSFMLSLGYRLENFINPRGFRLR